MSGHPCPSVSSVVDSAAPGTFPAHPTTRSWCAQTATAGHPNCAKAAGVRGCAAISVRRTPLARPLLNHPCPCLARVLGLTHGCFVGRRGETTMGPAPRGWRRAFCFPCPRRRARSRHGSTVRQSRRTTARQPSSDASWCPASAHGAAGPDARSGPTASEHSRPSVSAHPARAALRKRTGRPSRAGRCSIESWDARDRAHLPFFFSPPGSFLRRSEVFGCVLKVSFVWAVFASTLFKAVRRPSGVKPGIRESS